MANFNQKIQKDTEAVMNEWITSEYLQKGDLFVIGCSTSEVAGQPIGTSGREDIAAILFEELNKFKQKTGVYLVFQCCEHLNRALVIEKEAMQRYQLEEVSVIPVPTAGGSMAANAYRNMSNPVVVETIKGHAGIDIGETMIGMQLKHVAVPLRFKQRFIGNARVSTARTRPKLIGGKRANYDGILADKSLI